MQAPTMTAPSFRQLATALADYKRVLAMLEASGRGDGIAARVLRQKIENI